MSDDAFLPPPVPLMSAVKARDLARSCKGMADHLRANGDRATALILDQRAAWWLAYAVALSQVPPGRVDEGFGAP